MPISLTAEQENAFQAFLQRYGEDSEGAARELYTQTFQLRDARRQVNGDLTNAQSRIEDLEAQVEQLRGQLPGENVIVLDDTAAARWQSYQALGEPDAIQTHLSRLSDLERRQQITTAAAASGYNAQVLQKLLPQEAAVDTRKEQDQETVYIVVGDNEQPLNKYAEENWQMFMPALITTENGRNGTQWPTQTGHQKPPAPQKPDPAEIKKQKRGKSRYASL